MKIKNNIFKHVIPFFAVIKGDIVIVLSIDHRKVVYITSSCIRKEEETRNFFDLWDGNTLLINANNGRGEWHMNEHKEIIMNKALKKAMIYAIIILLIATIFVRLLNISFFWQLVPMLVLCGIGLALSILLLQEQAFTSNKISRRICEMVRNGNCKSIIHSGASKAWGAISWSEIGFSFFLTYVITLVFYDNAWGMLAIINICTLPYTIWSVGYQKFVAKMWCMLCVFVQVILVCMALVFMSKGLYTMNIKSAATFVVLFAIILLCSNLFMDIYAKSKALSLCESTYGKLKLSNGVLNALAKKGVRIERV